MRTLTRLIRARPTRRLTPPRTTPRAVALAAALVMTAGGCTGGGDEPGADAGSPEPPAVTVELTPADASTDIPVSAEVGIRADGGEVTAVALADAQGRPVEGELRPDGSSWVPAEPLAYTTSYTATVTARAGDGSGEATATTTFTTMQRPGNRMGAHIFMADDAVYGQAMPVVVEFRDGGVPAQYRATVERRLFVRSDPPQEGVWHWDSDIQVEYRPREYWQPGTTLDIRLGLGGLPIGDGRYGEVDITIAASIDTVRRAVEIDDATKRLTATQDGQAVKTMPVSLGKPSDRSMSGHMVVMEKLEDTVFDSSTYGTPVNSPDGYRTKVKYAERLTWSGQFIHAAPWSVDAQGRRNVSHGCVNVSTENGRWLYDWLKIGDPVVVKGTGRKLDVGNGWTAWDLSWEDFRSGSALSRAGGGASPTGTPG